MWNKFRNLALEHQVLLLLMGIALASSVLSAVLSEFSWWSTMFQNFGSEILGALLTFWLFEKILKQDQHDEELLKDIRSGSRDLALRAINELREDGRLFGGFLCKRDLSRANLSGIRLEGPNLREATLVNASLQHTTLIDANLENATLMIADLQGAKLLHSHMQGANLMMANLCGARLVATRLEGANLQDCNFVQAKMTICNLSGADLRRANLMDARLDQGNFTRADFRKANLLNTSLLWVKLDDALFDEETVLPDGRRWTPDCDLRCFTEPEHVDFWRPPGSLEQEVA